MSKNNNSRGGCIDVFHSKYLRILRFTGKYGLPIIRECHVVPRKMITFSRAMKEKKDFHQWVCFYEDDFLFERIWRCPIRYLAKLKKFDGVVSPDFSVYYDMPFVMQLWNIFRSRVIGAWLQRNGIKVIPNIRFGDERSFECCCDGISRHSVIAIGTLGCLKVKEYRNIFETGIERVADILKPETIVFYGSAPSNISKIKEKSINVVVIKPESFHKKEEVKR